MYQTTRPAQASADNPTRPTPTPIPIPAPVEIPPPPPVDPDEDEFDSPAARDVVALAAARLVADKVGSDVAEFEVAVVEELGISSVLMLKYAEEKLLRFE